LSFLVIVHFARLFVLFFFFQGLLVLAPVNGTDCTSLFLDGQFCIKKIA